MDRWQGRGEENVDYNKQAKFLFSDPCRLKADEVGAEHLGEVRLLE